MDKDKLNDFYHAYVENFGEDAAGLVNLEHAMITGDYSKVNSMMVSAYGMWRDAEWYNVKRACSLYGRTADEQIKIGEIIDDFKAMSKAV
jgi:hypothetical protein